MKTLRQIFAATVAGTFILTACVPQGFAQEGSHETLNLIVGDLDNVKVKNLTRVSVTDPDIADISDAQSDKITVLGKAVGQTAIFLWDDAGKRTVTVQVNNQNLSLIKGRIENLLQKAGVLGVRVEESKDEGKLILSGDLGAENMDRMESIVSPYDDQIINLVKEEESKDLIQVDMYIAEVNTTYTKNLGINWTNSGTTEDNSPLRFGYEETIPTQTGKLKDLVKLGDFGRTTPVVAIVNALEKEGNAKLLSKPRLVVVSGKEASFLVGGEIPVESTTLNTTGGTVTSNTTFKQYGVNMTVTPTLKEGKIDVVLNLQISDVDGSKAGKDTAYLTRTAQTNLLLNNGQTIVMAGLVKHTTSNEVKRVPFLGRMPIIGAAFTNKRNPTPNADTELVIILTPTILKDKKYSTKEIVMPTPAIRQMTKEVIDDQYEQAPVNGGATYKDLGSKDPVSGAINVPVEKPVTAPVLPKPVVKPSPSASSGAVVVPLTPYVGQIQQKISGAISYPYEALKNNWQGTVKLKLHILKDGTLDAVSILESSGHNVFDQDAINTAKIVAPYPSFTSDMGSQEDLYVTVPIVYSQSSLTKVGNSLKEIN